MSLIHAKLQETVKHKPRYHGNGFIQLYLNDDKTKRLHIWSPHLEPPRDHNAQIHDHRFYMHSEILLGRLQHTLYDMVERSPNSDYGHVVYKIIGVSKFDTDVMKNPVCCDMLMREEFVFVAGCSYEQRNGTFHTSINPDPDRYIATLVTKLPALPTRRDGQWARVAVTRGIDSKDVTHAFEPSLQPTQEVLWREINNVLDLICNSA